jgi:hypothetical protein
MYMLPEQDVHVSEGKKPRWTIATARQNLPEVVSLAAREPQDIYRRDDLVARVVSADTPVAQSAGPPAVELIAAIQRACQYENYDLPVAPRGERANAIVDVLANKPARKKTKRR